MVQIHTLRDLEAAAPTETAFPRMTYTFNENEPRPKLLDLLFPRFRLKSFIFIISMIQFGVWLLCAIQSGGYLPFIPFSIKNKGLSYAPAILKGEVWRLITPLFLHSGFLHLFFNVYLQLRLGFLLEEQYGTQLFAAMYFVCGLAGNLFSLALRPCSPAVGASTADYGLIALQIAEVVLSWHLLQRKEEVIFNLVFFFMMSLMMSIAPDSLIDWRGHVGGFLAGFALGILYSRSTSRPAWYELVRPISLAGLAVLILGSAIILFTIPIQSRGCAV